MFKNIMVPLDGSSFAEAVIPLAAELARKSGATLHMVLVHRELDAERVGDVSPLFFHEIDERIHGQEQSYLVEAAVNARAVHGVRVVEKILRGQVVETLQRHVAANHIDVVIMSTHGRGGVQRAWLGSVTDALIRSLPVPVLALHVEAPSGGPHVTRPTQHILAATDGSAIGDNAFRAALALSKLLGARCTLIRAVAPVIPAYPTFVGETLAYAGGEMVDLAPAMLLSMSTYETLALEAGVPLVTRVMVDTRPADAILRCAAETGADLITLGTHGRNPVARWLLGSVADKVVRGATIPVLVCPAETVTADAELIAVKEEVVEIC